MNYKNYVMKHGMEEAGLEEGEASTAYGVKNRIATVSFPITIIDRRRNRRANIAAVWRLFSVYCI